MDQDLISRPSRYKNETDSSVEFS